MNQQQQQLCTMIEKWKLNKTFLASAMKMPIGTFKNKLNESQPEYRFKQSEFNQLIDILREMITDLKKIKKIKI